MFGISIEALCTIAGFVVLTAVQIVLILRGRTADALKLEKKKEEQINKLIAKREEHLKLAEEENTKIKKLKEIVKNEISNT